MPLDRIVLTGEALTRRARLAVRGAVQGVGFRPFVYRLSQELSLSGWVRNTAVGVFVEIEGPAAAIDAFLHRLETELPPNAFIQSVETTFLDPAGHDGFRILPSDEGDAPSAIVLPDLATCPDCLREVLDPADRRHLYPFANCTNCGPRFTIIEALPYDRPHTSMRAFTMCADCRREYDDPRDRRFHAQPIACPACGPQLRLESPGGEVLAERHDALLAAAQALREGRIVAILGLGGYHLACDARDDAAVARLRDRKHREEKPLACMFASLLAIEAACEVSPAEARVLRSPQAPIVLLRRRAASNAVAASVAPGNPSLGAMLPSTPLHHLLLRELGFPIVATSGNLSDEPICTDPREALRRLGGISDVFLSHDRPIVRHVDDSVVRVVLSRELVLRRARGYAPLPVSVRATGASPTVLAVGAHLKNAVALAVGNDVFVSQHVGDLETAEALAAFRGVIESFETLYRVTPDVVAADMHPDYASTRHAHSLGVPVRQFQHHHTHVAACCAENDLDGPVLGACWDGTGWGPDGTIWGGEFLLADGASCERVASFLPFRLPGGERAIREPRRSALGVLHAMHRGDLSACEGLAPLRAFAPGELLPLTQALDRGVNAPLTSSGGRLFDAAASLAGLRQRSSFEGQAAMELEWACDEVEGDGYPFEIAANTGERGEHAPAWIIDWRPCIASLCRDAERGMPASLIASRFHDTMALIIVAVARRAGAERLALTGGCFQNRVLTERAVMRLRNAGIRPYWHQRIPPNDGGIALGQAVLARKSSHAPPAASDHGAGVASESSSPRARAAIDVRAAGGACPAPTETKSTTSPTEPPSRHPPPRG